MSPAHRDRERYERWHIRVCARCGRTAGLAANWSDGPICRICLDRATRTYGTCPGCRAERLLPGRDAAGAPACRDCTGITRNFRCRSEGRLRAGLCRLADHQPRRPRRFQQQPWRRPGRPRPRGAGLTKHRAERSVRGTWWSSTPQTAA